MKTEEVKDAKASNEKEERAKILAAYKERVGKRYTDGERVALVKEFHEKHLIGNAWIPTYLVNFGRVAVSNFVGASDFTKRFNKEVKGQ